MKLIINVLILTAIILISTYSFAVEKYFEETLITSFILIFVMGVSLIIKSIRKE